MATLTSANSALAIAVAGLFNSPQSIQGYSVDDSFAVDDVNDVETAMGVDGFLSAGFTPVAKLLTIMLQADSPSIAIFDAWIKAQLAAREVYVCSGSISIPGVSKKYAMTRGFLTSYTLLPANKKILQPQKFAITFQSILPANA